MFDLIYNNIGGKIKSAAGWLFIIESICLIITGVVLAMEDINPGYLLICVFGPIVAWLSSWVLYAFGQLVEDVHEIRCRERHIENTQQKTVVLPVEEQETTSAGVYIVGSDIPAGKHTIFATDSQGGMIYVHSLDNEFLDRRYIKTKEKINLKSGTRVKLVNCKISFE